MANHRLQRDDARRHRYRTAVDELPELAELHDLRYLGSNFRERERIKRKKARWQAKLAKLDPLERAAIMECLRELEAAE